MIPITHKTITIPFSFFFINTSRTAITITPSIQLEQPQKLEPQEQEDITASPTTRTGPKKIHRLYAEDCNVDEVLRLLDRLSPDSLNLSSIIHALCDSNHFAEAHHRLLLSIASNCVPNERTCNVLIARLLYSQTPYRTLYFVRRLFDVKLEFVPSLVIYNHLMNQLCSLSRPSEAYRLFFDMKSRGHCPNIVEVVSPNVVTLNTAINGLCKMGRIEEALKVLNDMIIGKFCAPDSVTFTTVICGLLNIGRTQEAFHFLYHIMSEHGVRPSVVTYNAVLEACSNFGKQMKQWGVSNGMMSDGVAADCATYTIIIDGLCETGQIEEAQRFWDDVIWPSKIHDNFVYAALIKGFCRSGKLNEACHFLYELVDSGVAPNIFNYNILIDSACKLGLRRQAYKTVGEMRRNGLAPDAVTWRILDKLHGNVGWKFSVEDATLQSRGGPQDIDTEELRLRSKSNSDSSSYKKTETI